MNKKTIIEFVLIPVAIVGMVCGGGMFFLGMGKRFLHSAPSPAIATEESVQLGPIEVSVVEVFQVEGKGGKPYVSPGSNEKSPLFVRVKILNKSENRKIDYQSFQKRHRGRYPVLTDEHGNRYETIIAGFDAELFGRIQSATAGPGESIQDVLIFEPPIDQAQILSMELGGDAFGEVGSVRFVIPRSIIRLVRISQVQQKR